MSGRTTSKTRQRDRLAHGRSADQRRGKRRMGWGIAAAVAVAAAIAVGAAVFGGGGADRGAGESVGYDIGAPGPGQPAPDFTLASTTGEQISLADYRGQTVLLYFQEGLMCQPCWDQMRDLEQVPADIEAAGIDQMLAITTDPIDLVTRKVRDDGLSTPTLSDPDLAVSRTYETNMYGMMGESRNGHSFILVGPDGTIVWRADYGGAPDHTMYVPVDQLLADLQAGRSA